MDYLNTYLGIDIGGTNTEVGLVDENGKCLEVKRFATPAKKSFDDFLTELDLNIAPFLSNSDYKLIGAGIGAPGANNETGFIENPENFSWGTVDLTSVLAKQYHFPVKLINDAIAAALGEMAYGQARNLKNFIQITLGTGLGSSVIVDGKIVQGHHGLSGELGHTKVNNGLRKCSCGKSGCLETYVSANGVCRTVFEILSKDKLDSELKKYSFDQLSSQIVAELAAKKDAVALEAYRVTGHILGEKLADVISLLNPQAIVFAGGLAAAGKHLFEPMKMAIEANLLNMHKNTVDILVSDPLVNYAVLGAASLVINQNGKS